MPEAPMTLQWSRGLLTAETWAAADTGCGLGWLQWSRGLLTAETANNGTIEGGTDVALQWSRGLLTAETDSPRHSTRGCESGFNGAAVF